MIQEIIYKFMIQYEFLVQVQVKSWSGVRIMRVSNMCLLLLYSGLARPEKEDTDTGS